MALDKAISIMEEMSGVTRERRRKWRIAIAHVEKAWENLDEASEQLADIYAPGTKTLIAAAKSQTQVALVAMRNLLRTMRGE